MVITVFNFDWRISKFSESHLNLIDDDNINFRHLLFKMYRKLCDLIKYYLPHFEMPNRRASQLSYPNK